MPEKLQIHFVGRFRQGSPDLAKKAGCYAFTFDAVTGHRNLDGAELQNEGDVHIRVLIGRTDTHRVVTVCNQEERK